VFSAGVASSGEGSAGVVFSAGVAELTIVGIDVDSGSVVDDSASPQAATIASNNKIMVRRT
jgi:hypothetical protein